MTEDQIQQIEDAMGELMLIEALLDVIEEGHMREPTQDEISKQASLATVGKRVLDGARAKLNGVAAPRPRAAGGSTE